MKKGPNSGFHDFREVDRESRPEGFVEYLDTVTDVAAVQAYKRRSYDLLHLAPGQSVLDVGCGTGEDVCAIARRIGPSGRVIGLDKSGVMIAEAKKRSSGLGLPVEFHSGNVLKLPFDDDTFHATRAERMFQHLTEPETALKEMIRVTRPGGTIGVMDPDWGTILVDSSDKDLTRKIFALSEDNAAVNPWMGRQLYSLFNRNGLGNLQVLAINVPVLSFAVAEAVLNLRSYVKRAVENRIITEAQGESWLREQEERAHGNRFFSSLSGFGLFGTKSPRSKS